MSDNRVLSGVTVLEMAQMISGPFVGMMLADLGADVIKIELPGSGDVFRRPAPEIDAPNPPFQAFNRGKRSITLDVRTDHGKQSYLNLAANVDAIIENFRPGTLERYGVGYPQVSIRNPNVVYCSITGTGSTGPDHDRPTYDAIAQALSGLWSQFSSLNEPEPVGPPLCDQLAGYYAVQGILAALLHRATSGQGQRLEVSMLGAALSFQQVATSRYLQEGTITDQTTRSRQSQSYGFVAGDGKPFTIHLSTPPKFWAALTTAIDRPDLQNDPRFATKADRIRRYDELRELLATHFRSANRAEWLTKLTIAGVPTAPIYTVPEALAQDQVARLGLLRTLGAGDQEVQLIGSPIDFHRSPSQPKSPAPELGSDNELLRTTSPVEPNVSTGPRSHK